MNKIHIFAILLIIFAIGCSSSKVTVKKAIPGAKEDTVTTDYGGYWSCVLCIEPEVFIDKIKDKEKIEFAEALEEIKNNKYNKAKEKLKNLIKSDNDTIAYNSKRMFSELLKYEGAFKENYELYYDKSKSEEENIKHITMSEFMNANEKMRLANNDTIHFETDNDFIIIPVTINGKQYRFLFDTGAQLTIIKASIAKSLKLEFNDYDTEIQGSTNKTVKTNSILIDSLSVGASLFTNKPAVIVPDKDMEFKFLFFTFLEFDGIIGYDVIKNYNVLIDYPKKIIILYTESKEEFANDDKNLFWLVTPIINFKSLNDQNLFFNMDTGAQNSQFNNLLLNKLEIKPSDKKSSTPYGVGGKEKYEAGVLENFSIKLDDNVITFDEILSENSDPNDLIYLDGTIGIDIIKGHKVYIGAKQGLFKILE